MKFLFILMALAHADPQAPKITRETIFTGKLNLKEIQHQLVVSKFYEVSLVKEPKPQFLYTLKTDLRSENFNAGIYKAKEFNLNATLSSPSALSLKTKFTPTQEIKQEGETLSFEGSLKIDDLTIGTVKYEFNLYDLPIRRVYNPKVSRQLENTKDGFQIIEIREY